MLYKLVAASAIVAAASALPSTVEAAATPSGTYKGSKSVLGQSVNAIVTVDDTTHLDLTLSGATAVNCKSESYSYDGTSKITLPGLNTAGDCVHDALAGASLPITIKSITYSPTSDDVVIAAGVSFLTVDVTLSKSSLAAVSNTADEHTRWFDEFKEHFGRTYTGKEHAARFEIFKENLGKIGARNADGELGFHFVNKFADLSHEEFRATHMGYKPKANLLTQQVELDLPLSTRATTSSVDWRSHSPAVLTPVKDQGQCGSCWAFSATEQIETDVAMATGHLYTLSPQQIVSCDKSDLGCNGGNTETAYEYVESNGLEAESSYPYRSGTTEKSGTCEYKGSKAVVSIGGYSTVSSRSSSEGKMLTQIAKSPISVCVDATQWQTYSSGVLGRSCGTSLDHCVQAVGYNAAQGYWIVRNSWNTDWGVDGYIYVKEGIDACGIAKDATIVKGATNQPASFAF
jgi:hypothetical protein